LIKFGPNLGEIWAKVWAYLIRFGQIKILHSPKQLIS